MPPGGNSIGVILVFRHCEHVVHFLVTLLKERQKTKAQSSTEGGAMAQFLPFVICLTLLFSSLQPLPLTQAEPATLGAQAGIEVTFAPTYGALQDGNWKIPIRG